MLRLKREAQVPAGLVQMPFHSPEGAAQDPGDLLLGERFIVARDQHGSPHRREALQRPSDPLHSILSLQLFQRLPERCPPPTWDRAGSGRRPGGPAAHTCAPGPPSPLDRPSAITPGLLVLPPIPGGSPVLSQIS